MKEVDYLIFNSKIMIKPTEYLLYLFSILFFISCQHNIDKEGYVDVEGGKIWYKIYGEGKSTPILILHGGPGSRSCNMIPGFSKLSVDRPIIFYDQLGSGSSERPTDTSLWNLERFIGEIDILRETLNLKKIHILGHSCGGTFVSEYLATKNPDGIESVIFSSPMLNTSDWINDANYLLSQLPQYLQDTINKYELLQDYDAPSYIMATDSFYARHLSRKSWPYEKITECEGVGAFNEQVYNYMWGPTEFKATGTLKDFDRSKDLHKIDVPILFLTGEHDEARPEIMYKYQKMAQNAQVAIIENAAHMTMIDNPEKVVLAINTFLKTIEN